MIGNTKQEHMNNTALLCKRIAHTDMTYPAIAEELGCGVRTVSTTARSYSGKDFLNTRNGARKIAVNDTRVSPMKEL